ncbi:glycosyltransferase [Acinetobacter sp. ANC 4640]
MIAQHNFKISVITAVYNAESCISNLIESLRQQQDQDFEWVVVDGASTDKTLEILKDVKDLNIKIISEPDFGIYDALNKGIKACSGEYYLVAGADDIFFENAISDYKNAMEDQIDMVTASILKDGVEFKPARGPSWRFASDAYISNHSLGVLINKRLHNNYGFYSKKFPIAADQLFIKECAQNGVKIKIIDNIVGNFSLVGTSSIDEIGACMEILRVQLLTEKRKYLVFTLYLTRILKRLINLN